MIVIGGGGSGLSTALTAYEKGAKVIVLEKRKVVGGNAALASAHTFAAESPTQRRSSVVASRDELFNTLMAPFSMIGDMYLIGKDRTEWMTTALPGLPEIIP
jgi:succinate dehydrogenase/fumarate reductase flavoprotein subunit